MLSPALAPFAPKRKGGTLHGLTPAWHPWSSWLASRAPREVCRLDLSASSRASLMWPCLRKLRVVRPARLGPSRGSWVCVDEDGPCWAPPRATPQAAGRQVWGPHSQNADSSPRAQGTPGLGRAGRRKGKSEAPRVLTACGLGRRMAVDWTWASPLPHGASATARIGQVPACKAGHDYLRSWRSAVGLCRP